MESLNGYYPDMSDFPIHEYECQVCGAVLELGQEECPECEQQCKEEEEE